MSVNILGLKENDLRPIKKISYIYGLKKIDFNIVKSSYPVLTSFFCIHCHVFIKCSRLP